MKIAVSSRGTELTSQIDPRFGRCAYFLLVDTDSMAFEVFDNAATAAGGGAGIQSAQFIAEKGAQAVITGNCGPNAVQTLSAADINLFAGQTGTVAQVIDRFRANQLSPTQSPTVADHYGLQDAANAPALPPGTAGQGMGRKMGGGRGMGGNCMGGGRGMCRTGMSPAAVPPSSPPATKGLTRQAELTALKKQMQAIAARIEQLEKK